MVRRRLNTFGEAWEIQQWRDSWIDALCLPLDLRLKTEVCAIGLYHKRREYERRRARLQQQGTRSAHLTIQSIGDTFANWSEDFLHQVSKELVNEAVSHGCTTIVVENLENIR